MKVNDLMIGNYCAIDGHESRIIHIQEHYQWVQLEGNALMTNCNLLNPIPITEDWLVKLGFEKSLGCFITPIGSFNLQVIIWPTGLINWSINGFTSEIKYLHQLQNLYFVLTNNELKV